MRSFSLSAPSMPLEEEMPKRPPEDSFSCVSVDSEIVDQEEATEGQSCQMLDVQHESLGMQTSFTRCSCSFLVAIFCRWVFLAGGCLTGDL